MDRRPLALILFALAPGLCLSAEPPRIDTTSTKTIGTSMEAIKKSLDAKGWQEFHAAFKTVIVGAFCPLSTTKPNFQAALAREEQMNALIGGRSAAEIIALAVPVNAALNAERAAMVELPADSPLARTIYASVRKYLDEAPAEAETYEAFFPYWSRERVEFAKALKPPEMLSLGDESWPRDPTAPPLFQRRPHQRDMTGLMLFGADGLHRLQIQKILATATKAYVFVGSGEVSLRTTFLLESGEWKAHSDFFGYPWAMEGAEAMECVRVSAMAHGQ